MKKLATMTLVLILTLTMIFTLVACGGSDSAKEIAPKSTPETIQEPTPVPTPEPTPEPEPEPTPEPEPIVPNRGVVEGNTYMSEYLGLSIDLPSDWDIYEDNIAIGNLEEIPESFWVLDDEGDYNSILVFESYGYDCLGIWIYISKLSPKQSGYSEIDFYNDFYAGLSEDEDNISEFDSNQTPVRVGNNDWYVYKLSFTPQSSGDTVFTFYLNITDGFVRFLWIRGESFEQLEQENILSFIS